MGLKSKNTFSKAAILSVASAIAIITPTIGVARAAPEAVRPFSAAPQPLGNTLVTIGDYFRVDVIVSNDIVSGLRAPAVSRATSAEDALGQALTGSELEVSRSAGGAFVVSSQDPSFNRRVGRTLDEFIVEGTRLDAFQLGGNSTVTPLTSDPLDVPFAAVTIPQQVFDEAAILTVQDSYRFASGVNPASGYGGIPTGDFFARGFSNGDALRNGYRDFGFLTRYDVSYIDRVEVVKGPASILYGAQASPGLQVNFVTKSPTVERFVEARAFGGSFENLRFTVDSGGSLNEDDTVLFRFNAAYDNSESYRDFVENEGLSLAPVLQFNFSPKTTLKLEGTYQDYSFTFDRAFPPEAAFLDLPRERFLGEPDVSNAEGDGYSVFADLNHQLSSSLSYHLGASYIRSNLDTQIVQPRAFDETTGLLNRRFEQGSEFTENLAVRNELFWNTSFGNFENALLVGVEYADYEFLFEFNRGVIGPINIFNPVYGAQPTDVAPAFGSRYGAETMAAYWQDLLTVVADRPFLYRLNLMVGGRFESVDLERFNTEQFGGAVRNDTTQGNYTSQAGVVYQPDPATSVYFGFSQSFDSINLLRTTGPNSEPASVTRGRSFEAGVKRQFLDDRVTATLNLFNTTQSGLLTPDPIDPSFRIPTGEQRSRGIELDVIGELQPGWNLLVNYAFTDAEVTEDNNIPEGDTLPGVPNHALGLWTSYEFQVGLLDGLRLGGGATYQGEREARLPNTIQLPEYTRFDASISYEFQEAWRFQINLNNITDEEFFESQGFFIVPQAGFNWLASVSARF